MAAAASQKEALAAAVVVAALGKAAVAATEVGVAAGAVEAAAVADIGEVTAAAVVDTEIIINQIYSHNPKVLFCGTFCFVGTSFACIDKILFHALTNWRR